MEPERKLRWARLRAVIALILRDMSSQYGRSPGGYVWAILEPLGAIIILALGFSLIMRTPPLGNSFILFYATGYLPYDLFQKISTQMTRSLTSSKSLLAYPAVRWIDALSAKFILTFMTNVLVSFLLISGILILQDTNSILSLGPVFLAFVLAACLGAGIGLVNCVLAGFVPVWATIWAIFTRPLLIASGVILLFRDLPKGAQEFLFYNPLLHITALSRTSFYPTYRPQFISLTYVLVWILLLVTLGLILVRRYHREILNR